MPLGANLQLHIDRAVAEVAIAGVVTQSEIGEFISPAVRAGDQMFDGGALAWPLRHFGDRPSA